MQDYMTKLPGIPSSDQVKDGMAFFAGTGPEGKTCGDCKLRGYQRQSSKETWNERGESLRPARLPNDRLPDVQEADRLARAVRR